MVYEPNVSPGDNLATALASGTNLHLAAGDHWIDGLLRAGLHNVTITGQPGARIISTSVSGLLQLTTSRNVTFRGITFEAAGDTPEDDKYGLVYSLATGLRNVRFQECQFVAPGRNINGAKFVADGSTQEHIFDGVHFDDCTFHVGRMGVEIQDHPAGEHLTRVRDVSVNGSDFNDCGRMSTGIDLSFSGPLLGAAARGNTFRGSIYAALEFAGPHTSPLAVDNQFLDLAGRAQTLSFTNKQDSRDTLYPVIERNRSLGRSGHGAFLWNLVDARMAGNQFVTTGPVSFRDCARMTSTGDVYDSLGVYAFNAESSNPKRSCVDNTWRDSRLSTTGSPRNFAVTRFIGERTHGNTVENGKYSKGAGGGWYDQIHGAHDNTVIAPSFH